MSLVSLVFAVSGCDGNVCVLALMPALLHAWRYYRRGRQGASALGTEHLHASFYVKGRMVLQGDCKVSQADHTITV
jgi:hypothetical protein